MTAHFKFHHISGVSHLNKEVPLSPDVLEESEDVECAGGRSLPQDGVDRDVCPGPANAGAKMETKLHIQV